MQCQALEFACARAIAQKEYNCAWLRGSHLSNNIFARPLFGNFALDRFSATV
jgi:hypothetical protein